MISMMEICKELLKCLANWCRRPHDVIGNHDANLVARMFWTKCEKKKKREAEIFCPRNEVQETGKGRASMLKEACQKKEKKKKESP